MRLISFWRTGGCFIFRSRLFCVWWWGWGRWVPCWPCRWWYRRCSGRKAWLVRVWPGIWYWTGWSADSAHWTYERRTCSWSAWCSGVGSGESGRAGADVFCPTGFATASCDGSSRCWVVWLLQFLIVDLRDSGWTHEGALHLSYNLNKYIEQWPSDGSISTRYD